MQIHAEMVTPAATYRVIETCRSSGGRKWGHFVALTTIRIPANVLEKYESIRTKGVKVMSSVEVDRRHRGPRSAYRQELLAAVRRLPKRLQDAGVDHLVTSCRGDAELQLVLEKARSAMVAEQLAQLLPLPAASQIHSGRRF
jgi:hypothetical protein